MAYELIREAKTARPHIKKNDERMLAIKDELDAFSATCAIFEHVDEVFGVFSNKANMVKMEFTKCLAQPDQLDEKSRSRGGEGRGGGRVSYQRQQEGKGFKRCRGQHRRITVVRLPMIRINI